MMGGMSSPTIPLADAARLRIGQVVRARVAGEDAPERSAAIWGAPGPRWFGPEDAISVVHADASMFVAGIRALLVQSLHPLAMAGVAGHSGFRGDPWGRLQRTSAYIATTTYGRVEDAERLLARIRGIHRRVSGTAGDGRPYAASDPHLLRWVHAAEADSFLTAYQRYARTPLPPARADEYVAQSATIVERLGVVDPPRTVAELAGDLASFRPELEATPEALDAARFLLVDPPLDGLGRVGYAPLAVGAVAITPGWARRMLRLPGPDALHEALGVPVGRAAAGLIRWGLSHPEVARQRRVEPATG